MKLKRVIFVGCAIGLLHSAGSVNAQDGKSSKNQKPLDVSQCTLQAPVTLNLSQALERAMQCSPDLEIGRAHV